MSSELTRTSSTSSKQEQDFRDLYRRSKDMTSYLSKEEFESIESNKENYKSIVEEVDRSLDLNATEDSMRNKSLLSSSSSTTQTNYSGMASLTAPLMEFSAPSKGQFRLSPDLLYDGVMRDGKPNGQGCIVSLSQKQLVYEGQVKAGVYEGRGRRYVNGFLYEDGVFKDGLITEGIRYCSNKSIYNGSFMEDAFDGEGTLVLPNGFFLRGTFSKGDLSPGFPCSVSIPSAKCPTIIEPHLITIRRDFITLNYKNYVLHFYFNGDIMVGSMKDDRPENGYFFYYSDLAFTKMVIGDTRNIPTVVPRMVVESDKKSKYFELNQKTL